MAARQMESNPGAGSFSWLINGCPPDQYFIENGDWGAMREVAAAMMAFAEITPKGRIGQSGAETLGSGEEKPLLPGLTKTLCLSRK